MQKMVNSISPTIVVHPPTPPSVKRTASTTSTQSNNSLIVSISAPSGPSTGLTRPTTPSASAVAGANAASSGGSTAALTSTSSTSSMNGADSALTAVLDSLPDRYSKHRFMADYTTRNLQRDLLEIAETYKSTIRNEVVQHTIRTNGDRSYDPPSTSPSPLSCVWFAMRG